VQREGQFLQLPDILYSVLERVDGRRTSDEIAQDINDHTSWIITGEQVRHVLTTKLYPLGLVSCPGVAAAVRKPSKSPLAVYMRAQTLGPKVLDPINSVLKYLFHPVLMIPMLVVAALAHLWLYRVHGLTGSLDALLATPGGLPMLLAVIVVAGCFHEFGHAAALTYGGGKVRGMGVGLYLMYPAFYTDVTDAYRLGRWARVRTDLGGIYFHAVACVGLIAAAVFLHAEFLLPAVALINIEMMRQFIPFVRLDGYWLLADLTGVPDFFSQMGPFVRSLIPSQRIRGSLLPGMKPWVKTVFAVYIVAVIPALTYFLFLIVKNMPGFLYATMTALQRQAATLVMMVQRGDVWTSLLLILTILLLVASIIGVVYIAVVSIVPPIVASWKWSSGIPSRMLPVGAATTVMVGSLGFLWYPELTRIHERLSAPSSERQARDLLARTMRSSGGVNSLRATVVGALGDDSFTGTVALKRPNLARVAVVSNGGLGTFEVISDGTRLHRYFPAENKVVTSRPGVDGRNIRAYVADQVELFFTAASLQRKLEAGKLEYGGKLTENGVTYHVVNHADAKPKLTITRYFIGESDELIHGVTHIEADGQSGSWAKLTDIQRDAGVDESIFRWSPPADAVPGSLPTGVTVPIGLPAGTSRQ
jgi:outer membrane lipoprotein-sorting protein